MVVSDADSGQNAKCTGEEQEAYAAGIRLSFFAYSKFNILIYVLHCKYIFKSNSLFQHLFLTSKSSNQDQFTLKLTYQAMICILLII